MDKVDISTLVTSAKKYALVLGVVFVMVAIFSMGCMLAAFLPLFVCDANNVESFSCDILRAIRLLAGLWLPGGILIFLAMDIHVLQWLSQKFGHKTVLVIVALTGIIFYMSAPGSVKRGLKNLIPFYTDPVERSRESVRQMQDSWETEGNLKKSPADAGKGF